MAERAAADAQLARILELLPRASRAAGVALAELAREMGISEAEALADLQAVWTREYYLPAGAAENVQVLIDADRVRVWTTGEFRRPPRLSPREALALGVGLRMLALESPEPTRPRILALAARLEGAVAVETPAADALAINPGADSPEGVRATLHRAVRERRCCTIDYLKRGAPEPDRRGVDPYALLASEGRWYLVGRCHRSDETRVFRADRVVAVELAEETFAAPAEFDVQSYLTRGRVYHADHDTEAVVKYSARIARWIEERGPVERQPDGSVRVRYRVADPDWLVRHVLEHGRDAQLIEPAEMRERVRTAAAAITGDDRST